MLLDLVQLEGVEGEILPHPDIIPYIARLIPSRDLPASLYIIPALSQMHRNPLWLAFAPYLV